VGNGYVASHTCPTAVQSSVGSVVSSDDCLLLPLLLAPLLLLSPLACTAKLTATGQVPSGHSSGTYAAAAAVVVVVLLVAAAVLSCSRLANFCGTGNVNCSPSYCNISIYKYRYVYTSSEQHAVVALCKEHRSQVLLLTIAEAKIRQKRYACSTHAIVIATIAGTYVL
jgi:hypothetical protein